MSKKLVRLYPLNPRQGRTVANYAYKGQKYIGGPRPTWYMVDEKLAKELEPLCQNDGSFGSPALFQIVDESDKLAIEQAENQQYLAQIGVLQGAVAIPSDMQAPSTRDISSVEPEVTEEAKVEPAGRSAALPPPRTPTTSETETASTTGPVTSEGSPKGKKGHKSGWHDGSEGE